MRVSLIPASRRESPTSVTRCLHARLPTSADSNLLHAHFVGWQTAIVRIVRKEIALTSARAPRHLSGLADAKVEQHCHCYGHYDEHQSHGSPPARCRAPIPGYGTIILAHMIRKKLCAERLSKPSCPGFGFEGLDFVTDGAGSVSGNWPDNKVRPGWKRPAMRARSSAI